ncbi:MAG: type IV secretion system protein [Endomicrobium sp.]|jgi:P-type conjugative transfer protein TrbL|nr:type IV secretion system protein [Endomicrobium sp.]
MKKTFLFFLLFIIVTPVFADIGNSPADSIFFKFIDAYEHWKNVFTGYAKWVFVALATIDMVLTFGMMAVKGELEFAGIVATLIQKVLIYGFFWGLLATDAMGWLAQIPNSGISIAENINDGTRITPDYVFIKAVEIAKEIFEEISILSPGTAIGYALTGLIVFLSFCWMAIRLFIVWTKITFMLALSPFAFALGALGYTRNMAFSPFISVIKATFEFVIILMIIGLLRDIIMSNDYAGGLENNWQSMLVILGITFICMSLVEMAGGIVEGLFSGSIIGNSTAGIGAAKIAAATTMGAAVGTATGGIGATGAVKAAASLAKEQVGEKGSKAVAGQAIKNLGKALYGDFRNKQAGEISNGNVFGRVSQNLRNQTDALKTVNKSREQKT